MNKTVKRISLTPTVFEAKEIKEIASVYKIPETGVIKQLMYQEITLSTLYLMALKEEFKLYREKKQ